MNGPDSPGADARPWTLRASSEAGLVALAFTLTSSLMLPACGGVVEYGPPEASTGGSPASSGGANEPASGGTPDDGDDRSSGREPTGKGALGKCVEGFLRKDNPGKPCNWLAKGRCYDEKLEACACVCPRTGDSTCLSGFYRGENSATEVTCF